MEKAERKGEYERVAELRYGTLVQLERVATCSQACTAITRRNNLLKEVVAEDIADIVALTGIPVSKMVQSDRINVDA